MRRVNKIGCAINCFEGKRVSSECSNRASVSGACRCMSSLSSMRKTDSFNVLICIACPSSSPLHTSRRHFSESQGSNVYLNSKERMNLVASYVDPNEEKESGSLKVPYTSFDDEGFEVDENDPIYGKKAEEEEKTFDFTTESEAQKLDRLFNPNRIKQKQYLRPKERDVFTKMLLERFYKDEGEGINDPAMYYQAGLEITWLEEWAEQKIQRELQAAPLEKNEKNLSFDDMVRLTVKKAIIQRYDLYTPLPYIIGTQPFFGCEIKCEAPLLCPRPETELWTHWVVQSFLKKAHDPARPIRVLDMCCGTGCIGVAIAKNVPQAEVVAVDLLDKAVEISNENAANNGVQDRYVAKKSDMFDIFLEPLSGESKVNPLGASSQSQGNEKKKEETPRPKRKIAEEFRNSFDILVSNPPYVLPQQYVELPYTITRWESKMALVGDDVREHKQYLYFQELCEYGSQILKTGLERDDRLRLYPNFFVEIGLQGHMVASIMEKSELFRDVTMHQDYAKQERWISANSAK